MGAPRCYRRATRMGSSSSGLYDCLQTTGTAENCLKPTRRGPPDWSKMDKSGHPVKQQPQPPSLATRIP